MATLKVWKQSLSKNSRTSMVPVSEPDKERVRKIMQDLDTFLTTGKSQFVRYASDALILLDWKLNNDPDPFKYSDRV
jgi:hypothetical protein